MASDVRSKSSFFGAKITSGEPNNHFFTYSHNSQTFQLRAHIYQARSLIGSDASGLSDPYAIVYITEFAKKTQVIEETLSPTWDELLIFDDILLFGSKDEIKRDPPSVVIEIYDQDKVGKSEFIGRTIAKPIIKLKNTTYASPMLEWFEISRGLDGGGELLAAFELIEYGCDNVTALPEPKSYQSEYPRGNFSFLHFCTFLRIFANFCAFLHIFAHF